jgi:hypothetical protein
MLKDSHGFVLSGATVAGAAEYEAGLAELLCYRGDPVARAKAAIAVAPDFAIAHAVMAWLNLLGTEPGSLPTARKYHANLVRTACTDREKGHATAIGHLLDGRWHQAGRVLEDVSIEHPRDSLALLAGHQIDFFTGHSRMLRDRIARALPHWSEDMPEYHSVLGMHAFGLEETGDYARAEVAGKRGVELEPRNGWAQHAVAHVLEMQNRTEEGIAWMRGSDAWAGDSFFKVHNWWHLALYHLELGDIPTVLSLFDAEISGGSSGLVIELVDASALLWRLLLRGANVGDRWQLLAEAWAPLVATSTYAFNDVHAAMAFVGAGRGEAVKALLAAQREAMKCANDNAGFAADVGHAVTQAIQAFGDGDYRSSVRFLRPVRSVAHRFGGSHAQRDVIDLTLIEAAFRTGDVPLAQALAAERSDLRHDSPLSQLFVQRAQGLAAAA